MLLKGAKGLAETDTAGHTLEALRHVMGRIKDVHLVARRGPVQAGH